MKTLTTNRSRRMLFSGTALMAFVCSCSNADLPPIENAAFITEARENPRTTVEIGDEGAMASFSVRMGDKAEKEHTFRIEISPEALERFNRSNGTSYSLLPETGYELSTEQLVISPGEVAASPVQVSILPYTEEMDGSGLTYALPVVLRSVDNRIPVLNDISEFLIVCNRVKVLPAAVFNTEYPGGGSQKLNRVIFNMKDAPITFSAYTFEFMMYKKKFDVRNYMIVGFDNEEGLSSRMWVRFEQSQTTGDVVNRWMQVNSVVKPAITATEPCTEEHWHHVAIVFDGSTTRLYLDGSQVVEKATAAGTLTFRHFSFLPQPSFSTSTISFRETRLWNVARTEAQLRNNMNSVDPGSEGLLGYWRMDEGAGHTFFDATGNGNDGECTYSNAGNIWDPAEYGPATGLTWVEDMNNMNGR